MDFVIEALYKEGIIVQPFQSKNYQYGKGESLSRWEIKLDRLFTKTDRLSIETHEKTKASNTAWSTSGILRSDNTIFYVQGNREYFYIFLKRTLVHLYEFNVNSKNVPPMHKLETHQTPTVDAFYLPIGWADSLGYRITP